MEERCLGLKKRKLYLCKFGRLRTYLHKPRADFRIWKHLPLAQHTNDPSSSYYPLYHLFAERKAPRITPGEAQPAGAVQPAKKAPVDMSAATEKLKLHIGQSLQQAEAGINATLPASTALFNSEIATVPTLEEARGVPAAKPAVEEAAAKLAALAQRVLTFNRSNGNPLEARLKDRCHLCEEHVASDPILCEIKDSLLIGNNPSLQALALLSGISFA